MAPSAARSASVCESMLDFYSALYVMIQMHALYFSDNNWTYDVYGSPHSSIRFISNEFTLSLFT